MTYPQPPWNLQGRALQTVNLIEIDRLRPLIPASLSIVSPFPGKTIGGIYIASYSTGSVLIYNELIVVGGLISANGKIGAWISHIYVDNPDSVAGGREIWGLPKELAEFTWSADRNQVQVHQADRHLCSLDLKWKLTGWQQSISAPVFSQVSSSLVSFVGQASFRFHLAQVELKIPSNSTFAGLAIEQPWLSFELNPLALVAGAPVAL